MMKMILLLMMLLTPLNCGHKLQEKVKRRERERIMSYIMIVQLAVRQQG